MPLRCPSGLLDSDAIDLALSRLPSRLEREYRGKLERLEFGTILELALIGRLLMKGGPFKVTPWPASSRVDVQLTMGARTLELEIKASIKTLYDRNVAKMCQIVAEKVERQWPGFKGEINLFNDFRETDEGGCKTLDTQGTVEDVMQELEKAISPTGEIRPEYREFAPFRLVTKIVPRDQILVWHSSWNLPGGHGQEIIRRTLQRALDGKSQFSGEWPALLAVIQARDPDPKLVYQWEPSPAEESFAKHPSLSAIIAIPCPGINGAPVVVTPGEGQKPARAHPLLSDEPQTLAEFLTVRLQVDPIWDRLERELRESVNGEQGDHESGIVN